MLAMTSLDMMFFLSFFRASSEPSEPLVKARLLKDCKCTQARWWGLRVIGRIGRRGSSASVMRDIEKRIVIMPVGAGRRPTGGNVGHVLDQRGVVNIEGSSTRDGRTFLLLGPLVFFSVFCWSLGCRCLHCRCRCRRVSHLSQRGLCCVDRSIVCCCHISVVGRAAIVERSSFRKTMFSPCLERKLD